MMRIRLTALLLLAALVALALCSTPSVSARTLSSRSLTSGWGSDVMSEQHLPAVPHNGYCLLAVNAVLTAVTCILHFIENIDCTMHAMRAHTMPLH
jgi:hypothetical protein